MRRSYAASLWVCEGKKGFEETVFVPFKHSGVSEVVCEF